jgi:GAF domain-containing protein
MNFQRQQRNDFERLRQHRNAIREWLAAEDIADALASGDGPDTLQAQQASEYADARIRDVVWLLSWEWIPPNELGPALQGVFGWAAPEAEQRDWFLSATAVLNEIAQRRSGMVKP